MRHGQADFNASCDSERALTARGTEQTTRAGQQLKQAGLTPDLILCSPLLRARQSAEQAASAWGLTPQPEPALDGRLSAAGLLEMTREYIAHYDCLLLVGHNPNISLAAGLLSGKYISFRPGDAMAFDVTDFDKPQLVFQELS